MQAGEKLFIILTVFSCHCSLFSDYGRGASNLALSKSCLYELEWSSYTNLSTLSPARTFSSFLEMVLKQKCRANGSK